MSSRDPFRISRERMVRDLVEARGVQDPRVLQVMREVPRHLFVKEGTLESLAYGEHALSIGSAQTLSQPYIVGRMTELLQLTGEESVLEVGTGSGYHTAVLAKLARRVFSLERIPELATKAIERMRELKLHNVKVQVFDGTLGWRTYGPFDRILVTAGAPATPQPLVDQLAVGGRLLVPEGDREQQRLVIYDREPQRILRDVGEPVAFVPLVGRFGW